MRLSVLFKSLRSWSPPPVITDGPCARAGYRCTAVQARPRPWLEIHHMYIERGARAHLLAAVRIIVQI